MEDTGRIALCREGRYAPRRNGYTLSCRVAQCAACGKKKIYSDWKNRVGIEILNNKILYE